MDDDPNFQPASAAAPVVASSGDEGYDLPAYSPPHSRRSQVRRGADGASPAMELPEVQLRTASPSVLTRSSASSLPSLTAAARRASLASLPSQPLPSPPTEDNRVLVLVFEGPWPVQPCKELPFPSVRDAMPDIRQAVSASACVWVDVHRPTEEDVRLLARVRCGPTERALLAWRSMFNTAAA